MMEITKTSPASQGLRRVFTLGYFYNSDVSIITKMYWSTFWAGFPPNHLVSLTPAQTGANPTIANCNASVVNFYNATYNLARFEN
jgi:hypothetical protein